MFGLVSKFVIHPVIHLSGTIALLASLVGASSVSMCIEPPIDAPISRGYEIPACDYCAGHRTLEFTAMTDDGMTHDGTTTVRSPVSGRVNFAGLVARTAYVSIRPIDDPTRTVTVGWPADEAVDPTEVRAGNLLHVGDALGRIGTGDRVTLSLRGAGGDYEDPSSHLGRTRATARLVPLDGTGRRPARRAVCEALR